MLDQKAVRPRGLQGGMFPEEPVEDHEANSVPDELAVVGELPRCFGRRSGVEMMDVQHGFQGPYACNRESGSPSQLPSMMYGQVIRGCLSS